MGVQQASYQTDNFNDHMQPITQCFSVQIHNSWHSSGYDLINYSADILGKYIP